MAYMAYMATAPAGFPIPVMAQGDLMWAWAAPRATQAPTKILVLPPPQSGNAGNATSERRGQVSSNCPFLHLPTPSRSRALAATQAPLAQPASSVLPVASTCRPLSPSPATQAPKQAPKAPAVVEKKAVGEQQVGAPQSVQKLGVDSCLEVYSNSYEAWCRAREASAPAPKAPKATAPPPVETNVTQDPVGLSEAPVEDEPSTPDFEMDLDEAELASGLMLALGSSGEVTSSCEPVVAAETSSSAQVGAPQSVQQLGVDSCLEVYSNTYEAWCPGVIYEMDYTEIVIVFQVEGENLQRSLQVKGLPIDSPELRCARDDGPWLGATVEIFSASQRCWCLGTITDLSNGVATTIYQYPGSPPESDPIMKQLELGCPLLRLPGGADAFWQFLQQNVVEAKMAAQQSNQHGRGENRPQCPQSGWQYIDTNGNVQGPFTLFEMQLWHSSGCFHPLMPMRCDQNDSFVEFSKMFPQGYEAFVDYPRRPNNGANGGDVVAPSGRQLFAELDPILRKWIKGEAGAAAHAKATPPKSEYAPSYGSANGYHNHGPGFASDRPSSATPKPKARSCLPIVAEELELRFGLPYDHPPASMAMRVLHGISAAVSEPPYRFGIEHFREGSIIVKLVIFKFPGEALSVAQNIGRFILDSFKEGSSSLMSQQPPIFPALIDVSLTNAPLPEVDEKNVALEKDMKDVDMDGKKDAEASERSANSGTGLVGRGLGFLSNAKNVASSALDAANNAVEKAGSAVDSLGAGASSRLTAVLADLGETADLSETADTTNAENQAEASLTEPRSEQMQTTETPIAVSTREQKQEPKGKKRTATEPMHSPRGKYLRGEKTLQKMREAAARQTRTPDGKMGKKKSLL